MQFSKLIKVYSCGFDEFIKCGRSLLMLSSTVNLKYSVLWLYQLGVYGKFGIFVAHLVHCKW